MLGVHSPTDHIQKLRIIKSSSEIELMRIAGKIASSSFHEVFSASFYIDIYYG